MRKPALSFLAAVLSASLLLTCSSFARQDPPANRNSGAPDAATVPVTTVVTVLGPNFSQPPAVSKDDISVYSNNTRENVVSFDPARGAKAGLQLAILIDEDDSASALGQHFTEIKDFIQAQPSTTEVGIYYASAGTVEPAAKFSLDHQAVAKKLRLPLGKYFGASPSIYLSLKDLADHWPKNDMRHEVLMIASGVDRLDPGLQDPYLDDTIEHVLKAGIVVNTIYTGGFRLAGSFEQNVAWQNLARVASDSGGQQFFQGFETPVNFLPIFRQLNMALGNQYVLTIDMPRSPRSKGDLAPIKIRTEQRDVHLSYARQVFVPGSASERSGQ
jgi:hypothetical protein